MSMLYRTTVDEDGTEHYEEVAPVEARDRPDGSVALVVAPEAEREEIALAAYRLGEQRGWRAGVRAGRLEALDATEALARSVVAQAVREVASGGAVAAALLLPRERAIVRDPKTGAIKGITESIA